MAERGGEIVSETGETERPFEIMSITKSVVSLVVGQLVDRQLLALDASAADFLPSWRGMPKEKMRVVHLLEHTSSVVEAGCSASACAFEVVTEEASIRAAADDERSSPTSVRRSTREWFRGVA